jgi:hypothetical protein
MKIMTPRFRYLMIGAALLLVMAISARAQVLMDGYIGYQFFDSSVNIYVEDVTNFGDVTTDRLRLRLWASEHSWSEEHPGRVLATTRLQKIKSHRDLDHVRRNTHLDRPSTDWYHVTLTLEERVVAEDGAHHWEIRDVVKFEGEDYIREHSFNPLWPFD